MIQCNFMKDETIYNAPDCLHKLPFYFFERVDYDLLVGGPP